MQPKLFDVSGARVAGERDSNGTGFRLYDRSTSHKAMAFLPFCCHTRFNTVWDAAGQKIAADHGFPGDQVEGGSLLPAGIHSAPLHRGLAMEYIGGFFDLVLNKDVGLRQLFDNRLQNAPGKPAAIQWRFGSRIEDIDTFSGANPLRTDPPGSSVVDLGPINVPGSATVGSRAKHVPHQSKGLVIDLAAVGTPTAEVEFRLAAGAAVKDLNSFDAITFGLGRLYPVTNQTAIDNETPPDFIVTLTDASNRPGVMTSTEIYAEMANGWVRPAFKVEDNANVTIMFQQTVSLNLATLLIKLTGQPGPTFDFATATTLNIAFDASAGAGEIWINNVTLIKK